MKTFAITVPWLWWGTRTHYVQADTMILRDGYLLFLTESAEKTLTTYHPDSTIAVYDPDHWLYVREVTHAGAGATAS